ncbi:hypothetical protein CR513_25674, partial [Mucuna pruriens]
MELRRWLRGQGIRSQLVASGSIQPSIIQMTLSIDTKQDSQRRDTLELVALIIFLSLTAHFGWELHQFDVKNAFLHGDLEMNIEIPPRFGPTSKTNKVCKLRKAFYELKQFP